MDITKYIPEGKENAVHLQELANAMQMQPQTIKQIVQYERRNGVVICSDKNGYWIPVNDAETKAFIETMRKQSAARLKTIENMSGGGGIGKV